MFICLNSNMLIAPFCAYHIRSLKLFAVFYSVNPNTSFCPAMCTVIITVNPALINKNKLCHTTIYDEVCEQPNEDYPFAG